MGIGAPLPTVQRAALRAEIAQRRVVARGGVALALIATGPTLAVLLSDDVRRGNEALAFTLTAWSLVVVLLGVVVAAHQSKRCRYLDAVLRYFGDTGEAPSLADLARDRRWRPPGVFNDEARLLGATALTCAGAIFATYLAVHDHAALLVLGATALVVFVGVAAGRLLWNSREQNKTKLEQLADGLQALREGGANSVYLNDEEIIRVQGEGKALRLQVRPLPQLPAPEYAARAYFGPDRYQTEPPQAPWRQYKHKSGHEEDAVVSAITAELAQPPERPLAKRLGPLAAALLVALAALLLAVSVVQGAPDQLPGWALHGPFLYEAARAALALIALIVLANLLMALASGRLISKVSTEGVETDAASSEEVAQGDRAAAAGLSDLEKRLVMLDTTIKLLPLAAKVERPPD